MKKWIKKSLKNQLTVFVLIAVIMPVFFLGVISYVTTIKVSKDRAEISGLSTLNQLETSIDFIVNDVLSSSVFLIGSREVQDYMREDVSTPKQRSNLNGFLANLVFSKEYLSNITLYPLSENAVISTNIRGEQKRDFSENTENKWWTYQNIEHTSKGLQETITLTRPVRNLNNFEVIGHLSISISQEYMDKLLRSIDLEWSGMLLLLQDEQVLSTNYQEEIDHQAIMNLVHSIEDIKSTETVTKVVNGERSTVFSAKIIGAEWDLVSVIPYKEYSSQNRYLLMLTVISIIIASLLVLFLVLFIVAKVLDPLLLLTGTLRNTEPGTNIEEYSAGPENEIGDLIGSYNALNERIAVLMDRVKESESLKRQVDLQALQNQINPHFLYNTLASIHWIALESGVKNISEMVSSLSTYLRYSLNSGDEYYTIEQEINHLTHYTKIQEVRYPNTFIIKIDIPDEVKQQSILKLILQPFIENSISHGILPGMNDKINIKIKMKEQMGRLHFTVSDDGIGMKEKKVNEFYEQFKADEVGEVIIGKNYGLRNVNLRLVLHYGLEAGLNLTSGKGKGLTITFSIPIEQEELDR